MEEQKTICEKCKYYIPHYGISKFGYYKIFCGHCISKERKQEDGRKFKKFPLTKTCKHYPFKSINLIKKEKNEFIKIVLKSIQKQLEKLNEYVIDNYKCIK